MLLLKRMYKEAGEHAAKLPIREARWSFGDAAEAVADRVAVGEEIARCPDGGGVVAEVGDQGLNQLGPVARVVVDDGLQCLAVEGFELLGVLLEHPEEEFVCS